MSSGPAEGRAAPPGSDTINLDHNASTELDPRVAESMLPWLSHANPSSVHALGRAARGALDDARGALAAALGGEPGELVFTASGSEANALALKGAVLGKKPLARIAVSAIEHPSLLEAARELQRAGTLVTLLQPEPSGVVPVRVVEQALAEGAQLLALMWANNETGAVQPAEEASRRCSAVGALFLCDGVQGIGKLALGTLPASADLFSLSGHKLRGPRGIGALKIRRGLDIRPLIPGHQERGRRAGSENVAAAVGLAHALRLTVDEAPQAGPSTAALRDDFEQRLLLAFPTARIHSRSVQRVPNTTHVAFPGHDGEAILIGLDLAGVCASLGAACSSGSLAPSHVLLAMGVPPAEARASIRFSLGAGTTREQLDTALDVLRELVPRCRL